jgi:hypothetical protein
MRSKLSRKARETACSTAFGVLDSGGIPVFRAVSPKISRFVILEGRLRNVNRLTVPVCPEVPLPARGWTGGGERVGAGGSLIMVSSIMVSSHLNTALPDARKRVPRMLQVVKARPSRIRVLPDGALPRHALT